MFEIWNWSSFCAILAHYMRGAVISEFSERIPRCHQRYTAITLSITKSVMLRLALGLTSNLFLSLRITMSAMSVKSVGLWLMVTNTNDFVSNPSTKKVVCHCLFCSFFWSFCSYHSSSCHHQSHTPYIGQQKLLFYSDLSIESNPIELHWEIIMSSSSPSYNGDGIPMDMIKALFDE